MLITLANHNCLMCVSESRPKIGMLAEILCIVSFDMPSRLSKFQSTSKKVFCNLYCVICDISKRQYRYTAKNTLKTAKETSKDTTPKKTCCTKFQLIINHNADVSNEK